MMNDAIDTSPMEEPLARIERELIGAYVAGSGYDIEDLRVRDDDEARRVLAEASLYASTRLTEIESRSHYLHALHGQA